MDLDRVHINNGYVIDSEILFQKNVIHTMFDGEKSILLFRRFPFREGMDPSPFKCQTCHVFPRGRSDPLLLL